MKVFNLTDVPTSTLAQYGMQNHAISVAKQMVAPGASIDVEAKDEAVERAHLEHFLKIGAVSINERPSSYAAGKVKAAQPSGVSDKSTRPEGLSPTVERPSRRKE